MLTKKQIENLAEEINPEVNLPILGEGIEQNILEDILGKVDNVLDEKLSPDLKKFINDASDGIVPGGDQDLQNAIDNTVEVVNKELNLPIIGEETERKIFDKAITRLFEAMKKGNAFDQ